MRREPASVSEQIEILEVLCKALGLPPNLVSLEVRWDVEQQLRVQCEFLPEPMTRDLKQKLEIQISELESIKAKHLEQELYNRKPLWIVLPADADADDLHFRPNGGLMEYVFLDEHAAEKHRQKAASPADYRVQEVWGK